MVKRMCASCGTETRMLIDNLCHDCYRSIHKLLKPPSQVEVTLCRSCFSYLDRGNWRIVKGYDIIDIIKRCIEYKVESKIKPLGEVKALWIEVFLSEVPTAKEKILVEIRVLGRVHPSMEYYNEAYKLQARVKYELCPNCRAVIAKKEKATVQVRAKDRKLDEREVEEIVKMAMKELGKLYERDRGAVLIDEVVSNGIIDFKLASLNAARKLAHSIQEKYTGKITETVKQIGISRTGRRIVRVTIRVLLPPVKRGEVILLNKTPYLVKDFSRRAVKLINLTNFKEESISTSKIFKEDIKRIELSEVRKALVMSVNPPFITLMLLDDYTIVDLRREVIPIWIKEGSTVNLLVLNNNFYLFPSNY